MKTVTTYNSTFAILLGITQIMNGIFAIGFMIAVMFFQAIYYEIAGGTYGGFCVS